MGDDATILISHDRGNGISVVKIYDSNGLLLEERKCRNTMMHLQSIKALYIPAIGIDLRRLLLVVEQKATIECRPPKLIIKGISNGDSATTGGKE